MTLGTQTIYSTPRTPHVFPPLRLHTCTNTQMSDPSSLLSCFSLSVSLRHPSLSMPMDYQTSFYHCTLQVKKRSRGAPHTAPFDFYVAPTGSSIIAPPGTPVHRDPDEMLSWHRYQSPHACPSPVPDVQEGGMCCSGRSPLFLPMFALCDGGAKQPRPFVT